MIKFGKFTKKNFGKKPGKFLVNLVGMFILWMVMGIWHGGWRYIVGVSLWYWVILMLGDLLAPIFQKITTKLGINIPTKLTKNLPGFLPKFFLLNLPNLIISFDFNKGYKT